MQLLQSSSTLVSVLDTSHVTEVSRYASDLALQLGLGEATRARAAVAVQAVGASLLKHADGGELFVGIAGSGSAPGLQVLALDRGRRLTAGGSDAPGDGAVLAATIFPEGGEAPGVGGLSVAAHGQLESGDGWAAWTAGALTSLFVCDGVGTGTEASASARVALDAFKRHAERPAQDVVAVVHEALRGTRGAAVALAELDHRMGTLRYCALGNISATVLTADGARQPLATVTGIAGHVMRRLQVVTAPWTRGTMVVIHSHGLSAHWSLARYPGLADRRADVIAGVLLRDYKQTREDVAVVVARHVAAE